MNDEIKQWEYRVQTIGSAFGTKDENIQATLDEWGSEGWEAINVYTPSQSGKVTIVAKRPLTDRIQRMRSISSPEIEIAKASRETYDIRPAMSGYVSCER